MVDLKKHIQIDGEKLKKIRKKYIKSSGGMADLLNMNHSAYWSIENNRGHNINPKLNTLARILVLLDCKIEDIITEDSIEILDYIKSFKNF